VTCRNFAGKVHYTGVHYKVRVLTTWWIWCRGISQFLYTRYLINSVARTV